MTSVELFPTDVRTFPLKRALTASVLHAGGHLPHASVWGRLREHLYRK